MTYGTVRWFGESWGAPVCDPENQIEAPVGAGCTRCERSIEVNDPGIRVPWVGPGPMRFTHWHLDCWLEELGIKGLVDANT